MANQKSVTQTLMEKSQTSLYPDEGELFKSHSTEDKSSAYLVFFVHFLGGHKKVLKRHVELVNELGFDAYVFNVNDSWKDYSYVPVSKKSKKFGLKHAMADQIENHLNLFPNYKNKIVFAFSNISASAIEAIARRIETKNAKDIKAMICDSGPGMDFMSASYNLIKHQLKIRSFFSRLVRTPILAYGWSPHLNKDISADLEKFPKNFPILSIRGWRDLLITPQSIDQVFEPHKNLKWKKLNLPEGGHINGLRDFPSEYRPGLEAFLQDFY